MTMKVLLLVSLLVLSDAQQQSDPRARLYKLALNVCKIIQGNDNDNTARPPTHTSNPGPSPPAMPNFRIEFGNILLQNKPQSNEPGKESELLTEMCVNQLFEAVIDNGVPEEQLGKEFAKAITNLYNKPNDDQPGIQSVLPDSGPTPRYSDHPTPKIGTTTNYRNPGSDNRMSGASSNNRNPGVDSQMRNAPGNRNLGAGNQMGSGPENRNPSANNERMGGVQNNTNPFSMQGNRSPHWSSENNGDSMHRIPFHDHSGSPEFAHYPRNFGARILVASYNRHMENQRLVRKLSANPKTRELFTEFVKEFNTNKQLFSRRPNNE